MRVFNPKVSIIIPVYNGANYLREAIDSALNQTYDDLEIVVVNDGSSDGGKTESIALSYGEKVRYFSKPNGGVASALNLGIQMMSGEYFSWLSHDDKYYPHKIETQVNALSNMEDKKTILYSDFTIYNEVTGKEYDVKIEEMHADYATNMLLSLFSSRINGCTLLIHKCVFEKIGLFNETLRTTQDYEYWFNIFNAGFKYAHVKECLVVSRQHEEQDTIKINTVHVRELNCLYEWAFITLRDTYFKSLKSEDFDRFLNVIKLRGLERPYRKMAIFRQFNYRGKVDDKPNLWLYWENRNMSNTPYYIELCFDTICNKCEEQFNIVRLTPEDVEQYLPNINKNYLLFSQIAHKADFIKYNLLYEFGGIWLDSDTIALNGLTEIVEYIDKYDLVFTGYKRGSNDVFPLVAFLGAKKHNTVMKKMIDWIEKETFPQITNGQQPEWDEIGGKLLQQCIAGESYYMFNIECFSPLGIHDINLRDLFHNIQPCSKAYKNAYMQFLPNSVIGNYLSFMQEDILLTSTLLARIFKLGLEGRGLALNANIARIRITARLRRYPLIYNFIRKLYLRYQGRKS